jgi:GTP cyclohydrolase I
MENKVYLTWHDVEELAATTIPISFFDQHIKPMLSAGLGRPIKLYGIPRGGIQAALLVRHSIERDRGVRAVLVEDPQDADIFIDDIIDTGKTRQAFKEEYDPARPFFSLINKHDFAPTKAWIVFPWEAMVNEQGPEDNIVRILEFLGEDPNREGLQGTPKRVVKSWGKLFSGYQADLSGLNTTFEDGTCDEMVALKDIEFYSTCEHHMLPFFGTASIAYIPNGKVIGVSKMARILEMYSRRLQIQERLCQQVTSAIDTILQPKGSACVLTAQHFCMVSRGVEKQKSKMVTSSLTGVFKSDTNTRREFFNLIS